MNEIILNVKTQLTEHFTLGEMTKTRHAATADNMPTQREAQNLKHLCEWMEELRRRYNERYILPETTPYGARPELEYPIVINSGFRSEAVNKAVGGATTSNHLTGCAADISCLAPEEAVRYAEILMEISVERRESYDEIYIERHGTQYWLHLAVRREGQNRSRFGFILK